MTPPALTQAHPHRQGLTPILRATTPLASYPLTSIDRSPGKAIRTVPMRVLSLGYPRTGTMSTAAALAMLGFDDVYHMASVFENVGDCGVWLRAVRGKMMEREREREKVVGDGEKQEKFTKRDWDALLGHCQAITDWPASAFPDELIAAYPHAKVILHVRPTDEWLESAKATILSGGKLNMDGTPWVLRLWKTCKTLVAMRYGEVMSQMSPLHHALNHLATSTPHPTPADFQRAYDTHNAHILSLLPPSTNPSRILLWGPQDGWAPLCKFLGVPVPEGDVPVPYINETRMFRENLEGVIERDFWGVVGRVGMGGVRILGGVVVLVMVVGFWRALGAVGCLSVS